MLQTTIKLIPDFSTVSIEASRQWSHRYKTLKINSQKIKLENANKNKLGTALSISDQVDSKEIYITRNKKGYFIR